VGFITDPDRRSRSSRLVAGITRARLLARLHEVGRPLSVRDLAAEVGLHPNSVREQLGRLIDRGEVRLVPTVPNGRGRPALRYEASPASDEAEPYRELARVLADELARQRDASARAVAAGERWGRALAAAEGQPAADTARMAPPTEAAAATERLVALLDASGFAPEPAVAGEPIRLRRCPFGPLAASRGDVVCGVHLGLMRGALAELGAPLDAVLLEPFVEPDLCLAHLGPATGRDAPQR
jgi:predicted ArsR family transcriptional regulator